MERLGEPALVAVYFSLSLSVRYWPPSCVQLFLKCRPSSPKEDSVGFFFFPSAENIKAVRAVCGARAWRCVPEQSLFLLKLFRPHFHFPLLCSFHRLASWVVGSLLGKGGGNEVTAAFSKRSDNYLLNTSDMRPDWVTSPLKFIVCPFDRDKSLFFCVALKHACT